MHISKILSHLHCFSTRQKCSQSTNIHEIHEAKSPSTARDKESRNKWHDLHLKRQYCDPHDTLGSIKSKKPSSYTQRKESKNEWHDTAPEETILRPRHHGVHEAQSPCTTERIQKRMTPLYIYSGVSRFIDFDRDHTAKPPSCAQRLSREMMERDWHDAASANHRFVCTQRHNIFTWSHALSLQVHGKSGSSWAALRPSLPVFHSCAGFQLAASRLSDKCWQEDLVLIFQLFQSDLSAWSKLAAKILQTKKLATWRCEML